METIFGVLVAGAMIGIKLICYFTILALIQLVVYQVTGFSIYKWLVNKMFN